MADYSNFRVLEFLEASSDLCIYHPYFCGSLNFPQLNTNCPPICTIPQGEYQELTLAINNPEINSLQLQVTPPNIGQVASASAFVDPPSTTDIHCVNRICGPFSLDLSTPGNWKLTFSTINPNGGTGESLSFNLQVTSTLPTPEFPFGSLLALIVPFAALLLYMARPRNERERRAR